MGWTEFFTRRDEVAVFHHFGDLGTVEELHDGSFVINDDQLQKICQRDGMQGLEATEFGEGKYRLAPKAEKLRKK